MPDTCIALAPMEGLADVDLRAVLAGMGGFDWAVSPFVRVTNSLLPERAFFRVCPELRHGSRTPDGTPVRVQLLGSDPECLADNADRLVALSPLGVDLNFGCPAPTVNRHRGGAVLLAEPELLHRIASAVRPKIPHNIPFTAKMRLGVEDVHLAVECALALQAGGVDALIVHGRTRADGYRPPARWEEIARVREALVIPVMANGEVWNVADYAAIRAATGCDAIMLGRGAVADPFLARRIRDLRDSRGLPNQGWRELFPALQTYWSAVCRRVAPRHAPGRLKQWLALLNRAYPEAALLSQQLRALTRVAEVDALLAAQRF
ncbi:MAG: tRNA-dihydrouridine synthase [Zoogloeaceae bacterium]|jgi:tRNA-dihydrouridine synthase C|nr:tRNA-dihydrouridine synthase [Zoogloeaceae bacterium]